MSNWKEDLVDPRPLRQEMYLAKLHGVYDGELPAPVTKEDKYLYELAMNGASGGGIAITDASYLFYETSRSNQVDEVLRSLGKVTNIRAMFMQFKDSRDIDLSTVDLSGIETAANAFNSSYVRNVNFGHLPATFYSFDSCFYNATRLETIEFTMESSDAEKRISFANAFYKCSQLAAFPLDMQHIKKQRPNVTFNFENAFYNCSNMAGVADFCGVGIMGSNGILNGCTKIEEVLNINMRTSATFSTPFGTSQGRSALRRLTFTDGSLAPAGAIYLNYCSFNRDSMVELFESLPTATNGQSISIIGNPCVTDGTLTEADKAIATAKGWTLTE